MSDILNNGWNKKSHWVYFICQTSTRPIPPSFLINRATAVEFRKWNSLLFKAINTKCNVNRLVCPYLTFRNEKYFFAESNNFLSWDFFLSKIYRGPCLLLSDFISEPCERGLLISSLWMRRWLWALSEMSVIQSCDVKSRVILFLPVFICLFSLNSPNRYCRVKFQKVFHLNRC